jgi:hypothetical protein
MNVTSIVSVHGMQDLQTLIISWNILTHGTSSREENIASRINQRTHQA